LKTLKTSVSMPKSKYEILMVCTGNICRSPMAEGLLRHLLPQEVKTQVSVRSAGTQGLHGHQAAEFALQAMTQWGIDISAHRARLLTRDLVRQADLILAMEQAHLEVVRGMSLFGKPNARLLTYFGPYNLEPEIADPYGYPLTAYEECLKIMHPCINGLIRWLVFDDPRLDEDELDHIVPPM
jgi:protein-tyrosine phosphatase